MSIKDIVRELLIFFHLDLTKNLKYDRLTKIIIKQSIESNYNCIDIGCHKGEILNLMLKYAPKGKHLAFEPIPYLFEGLSQKYGNKVELHACALSDTNGETSFQLVKNAPAYSGIKKRRYDIDNPEIEEINVALRTLDGIVPADKIIHFVKIDVEGGEFGVLKGGLATLKKSQPIILFECGQGASEYYGTNPRHLFQFVNNEIGLKIYTLQSFIKDKINLSENHFNELFETNKEYYFVAAP